MSGWNLPPGCSTSDLPGNRPIDRKADKAVELSEERWEEGGSEMRGEMISKASECRELEDWPQDVIEGYTQYLMEEGLEKEAKERKEERQLANNEHYIEEGRHRY